jgi:hypothetical protein
MCDGLSQQGTGNQSEGLWATRQPFGGTMPNAIPWRTTAAIEFVAARARERAARYRERASQLALMIEAEPDSALRGELGRLRARYDALADEYDLT